MMGYATDPFRMCQGFPRRVGLPQRLEATRQDDEYRTDSFTPAAASASSSYLCQGDSDPSLLNQVNRKCSMLCSPRQIFNPRSSHVRTNSKHSHGYVFMGFRRPRTEIGSRSSHKGVCIDDLQIWSVIDKKLYGLFKIRPSPLQGRR